MNIQGTSGNDILTGTNSSDLILGFDGNDRLYGEDGDDTIDGGDGNDDLHGGFGSDLILGGSGADSLRSGDSTNPQDRDTLDGGTGDDQYYAWGVNTIMIDGPGKDYFAFFVNARAVAANDREDDTFDGANFGGQAGDGIVDYSSATQPIAANLAERIDFVLPRYERLYGSAASPEIGTDKLFGIPNLYGGTGNDILSGGIAANHLSGGGGDDVIIGNNFFETARSALSTTTAVIRNVQSRLTSDNLEGGDGNDQIISEGAGFAAADAVRRLYAATLDRNPDHFGWKDWVSRLEAGAELKDIVTGFTGSAEFRARYGAPDDQAFVTLLYRNVLDREPDAGGLQTWTSALAAGMSRADVVLGFSESLEHIEKLDVDTLGSQVYRLYRATLDREPDNDGFLQWAFELARLAPLESVAAGFVQSEEFGQTYGALDDAAFVTHLYLNVLGRVPDQAGFDNWTAILAAGGTRAKVTIGFSESPEFIATTADGYARFELATDNLWATRIAGGAGDDTLSGGRGSDLFVFDASEAGRDVILDFHWSDRVELSGFGFASTQAVRAALRQEGGDVVLDHAEGSITFAGANLGTFNRMADAGWILT